MTLQDFADITMKVIREDGIADYLPTFALPDTQQIRAIQGIRAEVDHREAIQNVVRQSGYETSEFFFGVRSAPQEITVGHFRPGRPTEFMSITETADGYSVSAVASSDWWRVS
jgi:hypothetical protein